MALNTVAFQKYDLLNIPTTNVSNTLYTATGTFDLLLSCIVSNKTGGSVNVTVEIVRNGGNTISIVTNAPIPVGGSLECVVNKPPILATGDIVRARASSSNSLDASGSVLVTT